VKVLLDTHTFLWWNVDASELSDTARKIIGDGRNDILFSAASAWEISIKYGKGRLELPEPPEKYVPDRLNHHRFTPLPIQLTHVLAVHALPDIHTDPFDRLLIAQSKLEDVPLLSADTEIARYDVKVVW
jgi:PIN domain nuclease of toxin-antitoxin system